MIIRSISLKNVVGSTRPASFSLDEGATRVALDVRTAPALPAVIMTLLYPEEVSMTEIARVAGPDPSSAWRAEFDAEGTAFRVSRGFSPASIALDLRDDTSGEWVRDASGSSDVRRRLAELIKLPPPTVMETLNFWVNVAGDAEAPGAAAGSGTGSASSREPTPPSGGIEIGDRSGLELPSVTGSHPSTLLVGTSDYFDNFASGGDGGGAAAAPKALDDDSRKIVSDEYRRSATIEFVEDQIRSAESKLDAVISAMGASVDNTGELARVTRSLSDVPAMRELDDDERAVFTEPEKQQGELERRLENVDADLADAERVDASGPRPLWTNPNFVGGVAVALVLTALSLFAGPAARRFALGNVVALGFALVGFFDWLAGRESSGRSSRKVRNLHKRREKLLERYETAKRAVDRLRDELPVSNLAAYDEAVARRSELEERLAAIRKQHEAAFEAPEYVRLAAKKERAEERLETLRAARRRLGEATSTAFELQHTLERASVDPHVVLWRPHPPADELKMRVKRLGQVASRYRLVSEQGLNPKTVASWLRVAERIVGTKLPELTLTAEHQLVDAEGQDALAQFDHSTASAIIEALRMSLHLTLIKASAPGIHKFAIDVYPERMPDPGIRSRLDKMYKGLGERLQVLVVRSDA